MKIRNDNTYKNINNETNIPIINNVIKNYSNYSDNNNKNDINSNLQIRKNDDKKINEKINFRTIYSNKYKTNNNLNKYNNNNKIININNNNIKNKYIINNKEKENEYYDYFDYPKYTPKNNNLYYKIPDNYIAPNNYSIDSKEINEISNDNNNKNYNNNKNISNQNFQNLINFDYYYECNNPLNYNSEQIQNNFGKIISINPGNYFYNINQNNIENNIIINKSRNNNFKGNNFNNNKLNLKNNNTNLNNNNYKEDDFPNTNCLKYKNKSLSPDYTINKSRFINHKIIDKNKLNIRTPNYVIPSFKKRSSSQEKPFNFIKKYYDDNFIIEEENEDETYIDEKKDKKKLIFSNINIEEKLHEDKNKINLISNESLNNKEIKNMPIDTNNKSRNNNENIKVNHSSTCNKYINNKDEKSPFIMISNISDKISTDLNSNNFKKDISKIEDIISDSDIKIEKSIKINNNILKQKINKNLYINNFMNLSENEFEENKNNEKSKFIENDNKINKINIKSFLKEIKKNKDINYILETKKIELINKENSNFLKNRINLIDNNLNKTNEDKKINTNLNFNNIKINNKNNYKKEIIKENKEKKKEIKKKIIYENLIKEEKKRINKNKKIIKLEEELKKVKLKENKNLYDKNKYKKIKEINQIKTLKNNNNNINNRKVVINDIKKENNDLIMKIKIHKKKNSKFINRVKEKIFSYPDKNNINKHNITSILSDRKLKNNTYIMKKQLKKINTNIINENFKKNKNFYKKINFDNEKSSSYRIKRNKSSNNIRSKIGNYMKDIINNDYKTFKINYSIDKIKKKVIIKIKDKNKNKLINKDNSNKKKFNKIKKINNNKNKKYISKEINDKNLNKNFSDSYNNIYSNSNDSKLLKSQFNQINNNTIDYYKYLVKNNNNNYNIKKYNNFFKSKTNTSSVKNYRKEKLLKNKIYPLLSENLSLSTNNLKNKNLKSIFKNIHQKKILKIDLPKSAMNKDKFKKLKFLDLNMFNLSNKLNNKKKIVKMSLFNSKYFTDFDNDNSLKYNFGNTTSINNSEEDAFKSKFMYNSIHKNKADLKGRKNIYINLLKSPDYKNKNSNRHKRNYFFEKMSKNKGKNILGYNNKNYETMDNDKFINNFNKKYK